MSILNKLIELNKKHKDMSEEIKPGLLEMLKLNKESEMQISNKLKDYLCYTNVEFKHTTIHDMVVNSIYIDNELLFMCPFNMLGTMLSSLETCIKVLEESPYNPYLLVALDNRIGIELDNIEDSNLIKDNEGNYHLKINCKEEFTNYIDLLNALLYYIKEDYVSLEDDVKEETLNILHGLVLGTLNSGYNDYY